MRKAIDETRKRNRRRTVELDESPRLGVEDEGIAHALALLAPFPHASAPR